MEENIHNDEVRLYLESAQRDIEAAESNLEYGYYHIVISRAYYAMFYSVHALLASKDITRSKHSGVVSAFGEYFVKTGQIDKKYAKMITNAFNARLDSDYEMAFIAEKETAESILRDAVLFVAGVQGYFEGM